MRDIKFRGKRIYDDKWIFGNLVINNNGEHSIIPFDVVEADGHHLRIESDEPMFFNQNTIGQFTGLKDKNGVDIYEGDILECNGVKYSLVRELGKAYELRDSKNKVYFLFNHADIVTVIGNIHETKTN